MEGVRVVRHAFGDVRGNLKLCKRQKFFIMSDSSKTFTFYCLFDVLMFLCRLKVPKVNERPLLKTNKRYFTSMFCNISTDPIFSYFFVFYKKSNIKYMRKIMQIKSKPIWQTTRRAKGRFLLRYSLGLLIKLLLAYSQRTSQRSGLSRFFSGWIKVNTRKLKMKKECLQVSHSLYRCWGKCKLHIFLNSRRRSENAEKERKSRERKKPLKRKNERKFVSASRT